MGEVQDFHPIVKQWLTDNGYTFTHHKRMPGYGVVDFHAVSIKSGEQLLIECKSVKAQINSAIRQVLGYTRAYETALNEAFTPCIAVPSEVVTPKLINRCKKVAVRIISIDAPLDEPANESDEIALAMYAKKYEMATFEDQARANPQSCIDSVITFHRDEKTSPLADLISLYILTWSAHRKIARLTNAPFDEDQYQFIDAVFIPAISAYCTTDEELAYAKVSLRLEGQRSFFEHSLALHDRE